MKHLAYIALAVYAITVWENHKKHQSEVDNEKEFGVDLPRYRPVLDRLLTPGV